MLMMKMTQLLSCTSCRIDAELIIEKNISKLEYVD